MSYHAWTLRRAKPHVLRDTIHTLCKKHSNCCTYLKLGTLKAKHSQQHRQSKTQTARQRSQTQANSPKLPLHGHYTVHQNKHATLAFTTRVPKTLGPYILLPLSNLLRSYSLLFTPISPMKIPASAAYLNTCHNRPTHPVGSLPITSDRTVNQPQFTTDITRGPADHHHCRK